MRASILTRDGYGLPATMLLILVFVLLGLVGLALARHELRSQVQVTSREVAFYAAETGLARGLERWSTPDGLIAAGTTWLLDQGPLPGGAAYRVSATKLDDGGEVHDLYAIRSQGRAKDGETLRAGLLVATRPVEGLFKAGLQVTDSATMKGTADVYGSDRIPGSWNGVFCSELDGDVPGVLMADTTMYTEKGGAEVLGNPPLDQDADTAGMFDFGDVSYGDMAADADIKLPGGTTIDDLNPARPSYNPDGSCDTSDPNNWGDPLNPGGACADWFPVIYVSGDLNLEANFRGQGILLVDGNLRAQGGFQFYGAVLVRGDLTSAGNFEFYGGVKARKSDMSVGTSKIYYSACVLERTFSKSRAAKPQPLIERPWFSRR
ncbi:MAG: hypothetical protein JSU87_15725 [Gemmatimonadota bacterium]|nr:MAG: hypothetical protein JSU87_15725 [Gemmatimonadota bacterium]